MLWKIFENDFSATLIVLRTNLSKEVACYINSKFEETLNCKYVK